MSTGHGLFKESFYKQHEEEFFRLVKEGQSPEFLFIGCSDSRVIPELITQSNPGKLFVIRTAGNFVPFYTPDNQDGVSATIQFGVEALNIKHIIVCGHSHCGAIQALVEPQRQSKLGLVSNWLKLGQEAKQFVSNRWKEKELTEEFKREVEQTSVVRQLRHLHSFPFIKKRVEEKRLELHGWYFKIETGEILYYNMEEDKFLPLLS